MRFVHLRLHSSYSLAEGAIRIESLVDLCTKHRMPAVAVTDTNNLFGAMEFSTKCMKAGIQPIIAVQLNIQAEQDSATPTHVLLYAKNKNGYQNLIQLVSSSHLSSSSELFPEISRDTLAKYSDDLLLATGGIHSYVGKLLLANKLDAAREELQFFNKHFEKRLYIELSRHNNLEEQKMEEPLLSMAYDMDLPIIATNNVCYASADDFEAHDALLCIQQGKTVYDTERITSSPEYYFKSPEEMIALFEDLPEAIQNTEYLAQRCAFCLRFIKPIMPIYETQDGKTQDQELSDLATSGLEKKLQHFRSQNDFNEIKERYFARLTYELGVIQKMGFSGYFLIVADYVRWAKNNGVPVGPGRGSGAGSITAWAIDITEVDPIRFSLLFERFLNPDRVSMPDFDIDFCQTNRDKVINYVQNKYGYYSVSQIITFGKLQAKMVVRDVGRVLALPYGFVDKLAKLIPFTPTNPISLKEAIDSEPELQQAIFNDPQVKKLMDIAMNLEGLYRQTGVHAAGVVISDKDLRDIVPMYKDDRSTMPVTQFSMKYIESAGLIKFDFLGLTTLTVIQKALDLINSRYNINLTTQDIPVDDQKTFELFKALNCVGIFQMESAGMKDVLHKMQPDRLEDIMALIALYRPGPMADIPRYIACKHGHEKITYLHEKLEPILSETYGVMVYQEQVMEIAQVISSYSLGQADILRRAMGKKNHEEMEAQCKIFIDGAVANGVKESVAKTLFDQMSKFASYGFNKSHATSYGIITYQTAYLKANYPVEYMAAIMSLNMTHTDKLYVFFQDAKRNGLTVLPPDINSSYAEFAIDEDSGAIIYSLSAIKGSGVAAIETIVEERTARGPFLSIFDFAERLSSTKVFNRRLLEHFIKAGVFDKLHPNRHQLFMSLDKILALRQQDTSQEFLFETRHPELVQCDEWPELEKLQHEFSAIGFYLSAHPLEQYEEFRQKMGYSNLQEARETDRSQVLVIINDMAIKSSKSQRKFCILSVSDLSGTAEVSLFAEALESYRDLLEVGKIVLLNISSYKSEDNVRLNTDRVTEFDPKNVRVMNNVNVYSYSADFVPQRPSPPKEKVLSVIISTEEELEKFGRLEKDFRRGGLYTIVLYFPEKVILEDKYSLGQYDILDIRNIVGVQNVKETEKE